MLCAKFDENVLTIFNVIFKKTFVLLFLDMVYNGEKSLHVAFSDLTLLVFPSLRCFDTVGWAAGRASGPACKKLGVAHLIVPVVTTTSVILSSNKTG